MLPDLSSVRSYHGLSIVVPVMDDDERLKTLLTHLTATGQSAGVDELVRSVIVAEAVADAGTSASRAAEIAAAYGAHYVQSPPSRGGQVAAAIAASKAPWIWILHADTLPSRKAIQSMLALLGQDKPHWGRFSVVLPGVAVVAFMMNWRSRLTRICTGDQGQFMHRALLEQAGGFPAQPLMEDIEVSKRLKRTAPAAFLPLRSEVHSSSRRWQKNGKVKTILSMWHFRLRYFLGADARQLYRRYYGIGGGD